MYAYQGICRLDDDETERPCELQIDTESPSDATDWLIETCGRLDESVELPDRDKVSVRVEIDGQEWGGKVQVRDEAEIPESERSEHYPRRFTLVGTGSLSEE